MTIRLKCPCGQEVRVKVHLAGKNISCPKCEQRLAVPDSATESAPSEERKARPHPTRSRRGRKSSSGSSTGVWLVGGGVVVLGLLVASCFLFRNRPFPDKKESMYAVNYRIQ